MKRLLLLAISLLAINSFAQSNTSLPKGTLSVQSVTYNASYLPTKNWPCKTVSITPEKVVIGKRSYDVLSVKSIGNASTKYTIKDKEDTILHSLVYQDKNGDITIAFSDYIFKCSNSAASLPILSDMDAVDGNTKTSGGTLQDLSNSDNVQIEEYVKAEEEEEEEESIPFQVVEVKPSFQGGDANTFSKWVNTQLKYPETAKRNGVQGRVILVFTVCKDGSVKDVKVLRGCSPELDKEAVRVVSLSPKWNPGIQRGKPVAVRYTFPIIFHL